MITTKPIVLEDHLGKRYRPGTGTWVIFAGSVRPADLSCPVSYLEYRSHASLAGPAIDDITSESLSRFGLLEAYCIHRVGKVPLGEIALLVMTAARDGEAARQANLFILEEVKKVPIWKADGKGPRGKIRQKPLHNRW